MDENYHVAITNNLLAILPVDDPDFAIVAKEEETKEKVKEVWRDAIMEEYEWGDYLFVKGDIFAFNKKIAMQYLRYIATARLQKNNLPSLEELCGLESVRENPIPWISNWNGERKDQVAPQEIEKTDYEKGIIDKTSDGYAKLANIPLFGTEG
jgi:ribonucleoside-diphosphate reductase, beta subunit|nr:MAG TPA: ribonucleotide-diphosphate reductase subunit beta [Caudoviricetes sp.]